MELDPLQLGESSAAVNLAVAAVVSCAHLGARVGGFVAAAPLFPSDLLTPRFRVGIALVTALALGCGIAGAPGEGIPLSESLSSLRAPSFYLGLVAEFVLGMTLGWSGLLVFAAARAAGSFLSDQIGFSLGAVVDPLAESNEPILRTFQGGFALFVCFALDLHHIFFEVVADSFAALPPGTLLQVPHAENAAKFLIASVGGLLEAVVAIALPVTIVLILVSVAQGVLARVLPEIELFGLGFPARVIVGLGMLAVSLPYTVELTRVLVEAAAADGRALIEQLATG